ncbi:astacin [Ancylostoma ceylanicum]|uniref:Zinc metalloproteinase n=2 Tax=Ancylostoma ceylanicum TaxID=53326 RepID=A0A0D6MDB2_9BILA|nr:astacin [Ancylostoma ceylanicum]EYB85119.1 hypothetical protein Y032_0304g1925 [Ancylostoma ceylanicum]
MRLILLTLLLAVCVSAGFFGDLGDKVKKIFGGEESVKDKLTSGLKKIFTSPSFMKIREKLSKLKNKIKKTLELSPKMLESLKQRLAKLRPITHVQVNEMGDSIDEVNEKSEVSDFLYQGDIVLTEELAEDIEEDVNEEVGEGNRTKRQAFKDRRYPATLWADGVNYYFDYNASPQVQSVFRKGVKEWEKYTCINFKEDRMATDKLRIFAEKGCWSYVGRRGGKQDLSLGRGCESVATAAHELGHALGFFHTMSRHDRDNFITVNSANIKPDWLDQFTKQTPLTNENYGITYDYGSIMHYGGRSASYNRKAYTMVPFDTKYQETLGSPFVSFYELLMLNKHYNCLDKCEKDPRRARCEMDGFPNPRNCSQCICPGGYGGATCNKRPDGCGQVLNATKDYQDLRSTIGHPDMQEQEDFEICNYWIESPPGTQIEVRIDKISGSWTVDGCRYFGVEIKTQKDQKATGYRFCAKEDVDVTLLSQTNRVPIITFSREAQTDIVIQYRYVTDGKPGPKPTTTTTPRPSLPPGYRCEDNLTCTKFICSSSALTVDMKMKMCPKMCGYC